MSSISSFTGAPTPRRLRPNAATVGASWPCGRPSCGPRLAPGPPPPTAAIEELWKLLLLHQFHDIIPGSGIHWVYEDTAAAHARILDETALMTTAARDRLAAAVDTEAPPIRSSSSTPCPMPAPSWCPSMLRTRRRPPSTMPAPSARCSATTRVGPCSRPPFPPCGYRVYDLIGAPAVAEPAGQRIRPESGERAPAPRPRRPGEPRLGRGQGRGTPGAGPRRPRQPLRPPRRLPQLLRRLGHRPVHPRGRRLPG